MNNKQFIAAAAVHCGMLTETEAQSYLDQDKEIALHTIAGWRSRQPCKVKDGEEGIETKLWKKKEDGTGFYLTKAVLYREEQLEVYKDNEKA